MFIPIDVREVIDRIDDKSQSIITTLSVTGDMIAEQNSLLIKQNKLLEKLVTTLCAHRNEEQRR